MQITFPTDTVQTIDAIRSAIGRPVYFYQPVLVPCSACSIDPVTNTSTNSFCTVCSGYGYTKTYTITEILGHVTFGPSDYMQWVTAGQYVEGDCRVQIKYTAGNMTVVDNAEFTMIDNKKYDVRKKMMRGVKAINRILIDLVERI